MLTSSQSHEIDFYNWLSTKVTAAQLSNCYAAVEAIDEFCISRKISKNKLLETTTVSAIASVIDALERNKVVAFTYRKHKKWMLFVAQKYLYYAKNILPKAAQLKDAQYQTETECREEESRFSNEKHTDYLLQLINEANIPFTDKREKGGALWIFGGENLKAFTDQCKKFNVTFHYKEEGCRYSDCGPAWWTKDTLSQCDRVKDAAKSNLDEIKIITPNENGDNKDVVLKDNKEILLSDVLADDLYQPLMTMLTKQGITTVGGLREIKLWPFMNRFNLYSIATRQTVLERIQNLLASTNMPLEGARYALSCNGKVYYGDTPSVAYKAFCEDIAITFPLKFRNLIGKVIDTTKSVAIRKDKPDDNSLMMTSPVAYIESNLDKEVVIQYVRWISKMCFGALAEVSFTEEEKEVAPEPSESVVEPGQPSNAIPEVAPIEQPVVELVAPTEDAFKAPIPTMCEQLVIDKINKIVFAADINGISLDELRDNLGLTMNSTKHHVRLARKIVDIKGKLYHEDAFIDWEEGAERLDVILNKLMQKNSGYVAAAQLYEYARAEMTMFLNDNDMNDERSVYEIAQHMFDNAYYNGKRYAFSGKMHISSLSTSISNNFDVYCKFAEDQGGIFEYSDLVEYLENLGVNTGNLRAQMRVYNEPYFLYYDEGVLIYSKMMHINKEWKAALSASLGRLFADAGDHIILRDIQSIWFDQLPQLPGGNQWTPMLLQSVLKYFGKELGARTIFAMDTQGIDTLHAMLVQQDSPIQNFGDVVISYLLENDISKRSFGDEELRQLLVESNMIKGNELIYNMPKALGNDERFSWDVDGKNVTVLV